MSLESVWRWPWMLNFAYFQVVSSRREGRRTKMHVGRRLKECVMPLAMWNTALQRCMRASDTCTAWSQRRFNSLMRKIYDKQARRKAITTCTSHYVHHQEKVNTNTTELWDYTCNRPSCSSKTLDTNRKRQVEGQTQIQMCTNGHTLRILIGPIGTVRQIFRHPISQIM